MKRYKNVSFERVLTFDLLFSLGRMDVNTLVVGNKDDSMVRPSIARPMAKLKAASGRMVNALETGNLKKVKN